MVVAAVVVVVAAVVVIVNASRNPPGPGVSREAGNTIEGMLVGEIWEAAIRRTKYLTACYGQVPCRLRGVLAWLPCQLSIHV